MSEETFNSSEVQVTGKIAFILSIILSATSLLTDTIFTPNMEVLHTVIVIISSLIGIPFAYYKLRVIHHDYVVRKEQRKKEGLKPIKFRWKFWKSWQEKKKK